MGVVALAAVKSLGLYLVIALFEIAGAFAIWGWLRLNRTAWLLVPGVLSLFVFAALLTRVEAEWAGRAYAAYGGVYISAALGWLTVIEGRVPDRWDVTGAMICVVGAMVILLGPRS
jgi:small multidrug resistance family-3 protein